MHKPIILRGWILFFFLVLTYSVNYSVFPIDDSADQMPVRYFQSYTMEILFNKNSYEVVIIS